MLKTPKLALTPPNSTAVAPMKFVPRITTFVPARPFVGEKLVTTGSAKKFVAEKKMLLLVLKSWVAPSDDMTVSGPVVTPSGAVTVIEFCWMFGVTPGTVLETSPLNRTLVAVLKCTPVRTT